MSAQNDHAVLRDLARRYLQVCEHPDQQQKRETWRRIHALEGGRPAVLTRPFLMFHEVPELQERACEDPFLRGLEGQLRARLFLHDIGDDQVFEPFLSVGAVHENAGQAPWGIALPARHRQRGQATNEYEDPPIKDLADAEALRGLPHRIDEEETARRHARAQEALGELLPVNVKRAPLYAGRQQALIPDLTFLRGMTQLMMDMYDNPAWLHSVLARMRDIVLQNLAEAEAAGDFGLADSNNQAMPYDRQLADPAPNTAAEPAELWGYFHAQEYTLISPAMHEEFCLQYQRPIMEKYGLTAYGCCEDLTEKIGMLRSVPNLRRIAVTPRADVAACAERIGGDYTISWRPNPAEMVCCGFDEGKVRERLVRGLEILKGLSFDITLKDVITVEQEPARLGRWTALAREAIDQVYG